MTKEKEGMSYVGVSPEAKAETGMPVLVTLRVFPGERGEGIRLGEKKEPIGRGSGCS